MRFQHIGALAHQGTLLTGQLAHGPQHTRDAALLTQQPDPQLLERSGIGRLGDLSRCLLLEGIELIGELLQGDRCAHKDETDGC